MTSNNSKSDEEKGLTDEYNDYLVEESHDIPVRDDDGDNIVTSHVCVSSKVFGEPDCRDITPCHDNEHPVVTSQPTIHPPVEYMYPKIEKTSVEKVMEIIVKDQLTTHGKNSRIFKETIQKGPGICMYTLIEKSKDSHPLSSTSDNTEHTSSTAFEFFFVKKDSRLWNECEIKYKCIGDVYIRDDYKENYLIEKSFPTSVLCLGLRVFGHGDKEEKIFFSYYDIETFEKIDW